MLGGVPDVTLTPAPDDPPSRRPQPEIGLGTIALALAALSMALFAYLTS